MSGINRRRFLEDSMLATAAAIAAAGGPQKLFADEPKPSRSANEKLIAAVIGAGGRGGEHINEWSKRSDVEIGFICDIDTKHGYEACERIGKKHRKPQYVQDVRKLLEDKSIDFVSIATPNHWHSLAAIWAMQAGKDVYVEKPVSHNVSEGRRDVQTAERHKRICQAGTQSRSSPGLHQAIAYLREGKLGEVKLARALCYKRRRSIGPKGTYPIPDGVDYDLWSGPAPIKALTRPNFHYDWHWQWDYGNGDIGNQGIHQMDIARWGLGEKLLSSSVLTYGGRFGYEDAGETANTEVAIQEFADGKTLVFEVRGLETAPLLKWDQLDSKGQVVTERAMTAVFFYGTDGFMVCPSYSDAAVFDSKGKFVMNFRGGGDHFGNFLKAVRSRKTEELNAPILEGHISSALCHLGNISYRMGEQHSVGEALERLKSLKTNDKVQETLDRTIAHLAENKVKLDDKTQFRVGPRLEFDPSAETFVNNSQADKFLTRDYRAPFVVPAADAVQTMLEILFEDSSCLAALKPSGLSAQAPRGIDSLEMRVRAWLQAQAERGGVAANDVYLGLPHRLDRPVSGVILFAKTRRAARIISRQFERRQVRKIYWACVEGVIEPAEGTWIDFVRKVPDEPRVEVVPAGTPAAQQAVLHYRTLGAIALDSGRNGSWLEIELETGRMHQVRIQSASRGHPILGDPLYGATTSFGPQTVDPRERAIALHANSLTFCHPESKEPLTIKAPLGAAWTALAIGGSSADK